MRFTLLSAIQLLILSITISIFVAILISINSWYMDFRTLPMIHLDKAGTCQKVENFENGHVFNCNDRDVLLRRYRKSVE